LEGRPRSRLPLLGLEHRDCIEAALEPLRRSLAERALSELTFANLYLFRAVHDYRFMAGDYPCVSGRGYDGAAYLIPLFDLAAVPAGALGEILLPGECFHPVAAEVLTRLDRSVLQIETSRDDSDYLYAAAQFVDYRAASLRGQRGAALKLRSGHRISRGAICEHGPQAALGVLEQWCNEKNLPADGADAVACREALVPPAGLPALPGEIYYLDGQPAGFLLTEPINPDVRVVRFAKGLRAFAGIYPLMFQELCRHHEPPARWLNFECDLGKPNFRRAKLSYAPAQLLSKYRVSPRTAC